MLRAPNATVIRNSITVDWTTSFDLRSPLEEYILEENLIQAYTGNKLSVTRPNREVGGKFWCYANVLYEQAAESVESELKNSSSSITSFKKSKTLCHTNNGKMYLGPL